jgi:hypothetical protein
VLVGVVIGTVLSIIGFVALLLMVPISLLISVSLTFMIGIVMVPIAMKYMYIELVIRIIGLMNELSLSETDNP